MKRLSPRDKVYTMMMKSELPVSSRVDFGPASRQRSGKIMKQTGKGKRVLLLSQKTLPAKWLNDVRVSIDNEGFQIIEYSVPDGEEAKTHEQLLKLWKLMQEYEFTRKDSIVALGGGAVTDLAGFCASTYLRGIGLFLIPTTLLAQVDAAIGGKTAINLDSAKNLAGSFYFPDSVIVDPDFLSTLAEREIKSGMGEIVKYAFIEETIAEHTDYKKGPKSLSVTIADNFSNDGFQRENPFIAPLISICIRMKLAVVLKDPYEENLRRCLNLGHTLAHGLEKTSEYAISHGEAVSIGTLFAFRLSQKKGLISNLESQKVKELLEVLDLATLIPKDLDRHEIAKSVAYDKKRDKNSIKFVLPQEKAGKVNLDFEISLNELAEFIESYS